MLLLLVVVKEALATHSTARGVLQWQVASSMNMPPHDWAITHPIQVQEREVCQAPQSRCKHILLPFTLLDILKAAGFISAQLQVPQLLQR
jgi:hypothetical protein